MMDDSVAVSARPSPPNERLPRDAAMPELFASVAPPARRRGLLWLLNASLVVHVALGLALVIAPLYFSSMMPIETDPLRLMLYNPPPPPPPPLARGSKRPDPARSQPVTPQQQAVLMAPRETVLERPRPVEADRTGLDGDELGVPEGMEGGVEGGVVGGIPGGVLGGVLGGTGDSVVLDYDQPPRLLRQTKPLYSKEAFVKRITGVVHLSITIDATGHVTDARVVRSVPLLDAAAIQCVKQWLFTPAMKNGRAVATIADAPITFNLL
jgi:periplasmic protein TonB